MRFEPDNCRSCKSFRLLKLPKKNGARSKLRSGYCITNNSLTKAGMTACDKHE